MGYGLEFSDWFCEERPGLLRQRQDGSRCVLLHRQHVISEAMLGLDTLEKLHVGLAVGIVVRWPYTTTF